MDSILEFADILGLLVRELTIRYHYVLLFVNKDWYNAVIQQHLTNGEVINMGYELLNYELSYYSKMTKMRAICSSLGQLRAIYDPHLDRGYARWWYSNLY